MGSRRGTRRGVWVAVAVMSGFGVLLVPTFLRPFLADRKAAGLRAEFQANPCQQTADPLISLLADGKVTWDQAESILKALLEPEVIVQESYPSGEPIFITVRPKHNVTVTAFYAHAAHQLQIKGVTRWEGDPNSQSIGFSTNCVSAAPAGPWPVVPASQPSSPAVSIPCPGTHKAIIWVNCGVTFLPNWSLAAQLRLWILRRGPKTRAYAVQFRIPVTIRVCQPSAAEPTTCPSDT